MTEVERAKALVRRFHDALDDASPEAAAGPLASYCAEDFLWRGVHPFDEARGADTVAALFWGPLKTSFKRLQRRDDIFFAGRNAVAPTDDVWVASCGHMIGVFDAPWLGVQPTGRLTVLRHCVFHRVDGDQITETCVHIDIPHVMAQAGRNPFPAQTAAPLVQLGPRTHDGLLFAAQDPRESARTLSLIDAMIKDLGQWRSGLPLETELRRTWSEEMLWWGPAGIGSAYTIERYAQQHAGPFRAGFADRSRTQHVARVAEGRYGGFFGWPNFTARPVGGFMGMPATGVAGPFHVFDFYRRDGDKLVENWVFIDLLRFWASQGVDFLKRNETL